jgi:hypothetical protein
MKASNRRGKVVSGLVAIVTAACADLMRAVQAYKFFSPTVSFSAGFGAFDQVGMKLNQVGGSRATSRK